MKGPDTKVEQAVSARRGAIGIPHCGTPYRTGSSTTQSGAIGTSRPTRLAGFTKQSGAIGIPHCGTPYRKGLLANGLTKGALAPF